MSTCHHIEPLLAEHLFGELNADDQARLDLHLAGCPACRTTLRELEATLAVAAARPRPEPPPEFWDGFADRVEARLHAPDAARPRAADRGAVHPAGRRLRRRVRQAVAAVSLLLAGVFVGWLVFSPSAGPELAQAPVRPPVAAASLDARTTSYLGRSKILLLGLVNADGSAGLDLPRTQQAARRLADEAGPLQDDLSEADQQRLRALIADLEVILLQIANLEAGHDLPAIELVRTSVERRGLLLKINLTEIQQAETAPPVSDPSTF